MCHHKTQAFATATILYKNHTAKTAGLLLKPGMAHNPHIFLAVTQKNLINGVAQFTHSKVQTTANTKGTLL